MPQRRKPPRLWLRRETDHAGRQRNTWIIKDGKRSVRTGCGETDVAEAESALADYLTDKYTAPRGGRSSEITIGDTLAVYLSEKADATSRPRETEQAIGRLNEFFGAMPVGDIKGRTCREFATHRATQSGARRDLEVLRAAVRYYHKEYGLDVLPVFTLPEKSRPRERWLTRSEAAALLWACMGWEKQRCDGKDTWTRKRDQKRMHLARLVLIGLYTGTRPGAVLALQWIRSTTGGYVDLDLEVIFRRADGERMAHNKRKTPVRIAPRLAAHLARWKRLDGWAGDQHGLRHTVHYNGNSITKPNKAFRSAVRAAGLSSDVTPHVLRHTRGTWLAQRGVATGDAAASLGLTAEEYERTYLHNHPDFQKSAAEAF